MRIHLLNSKYGVLCACVHIVIVFRISLETCAFHQIYQFISNIPNLHAKQTRSYHSFTFNELCIWSDLLCIVHFHRTLHTIHRRIIVTTTWTLFCYISLLCICVSGFCSLPLIFNKFYCTLAQAGFIWIIEIYENCSLPIRQWKNNRRVEKFHRVWMNMVNNIRSPQPKIANRSCNERMKRKDGVDTRSKSGAALSAIKKQLVVI